MTTFLVDDTSGACDSLWTDQFGVPSEVDLDKYLFIEDLSAFDDGTQERIGYERVIFYSGSYEQIVLHQAFVTGILGEDQYSIQAQNAVNLGRKDLAYVDIALQDWTPNAIGCDHKHALISGGTGGNIAVHAYIEGLYNTKLAVEEACKIDLKSEKPVSYFHFNQAGNHTSDNFNKVGGEDINNIYSKAEELILSMQSGERGGLMDKVKYSGYTTAPSPEAPPINISQVIEHHHLAKERHKKRKKVMKVKEQDDNQEKIVVKQLSL